MFNFVPRMHGRYYSENVTISLNFSAYKFCWEEGGGGGGGGGGASPLIWGRSTFIVIVRHVQHVHGRSR